MAELQTAMTQSEYIGWQEFYRSFPFDDLHRYHRPAAMVSVSLGGGKVAERLEWLQPEPIPEGMSLADFNTFKALGFDPEEMH